MTSVLLVLVLLATAAIVAAGIVFTVRAFRAVDRPPVDEKPRPRHARINPHDAATTAQLKRYFEGKACAACNRPIPPVHAPRPGLLNSTTHEAIAWDDIPVGNLSATLDSHMPICPNCLITETFRRQYPELIVDRHRTIENPSH